MNTLHAGQATYTELANGLYRKVCGRCGGTGIYWINTVMGANPESCWGCAGQGHNGKIVTREWVEAAAIRRAAAQAKRDAIYAAEYEANRPAREAAQAAREAAIAETEARLARYEWLTETVGDKVTINGEIKIATNIDTAYGTSRLIIIETAATQQIKIFTTANWAWSAEPNTTVTVTGTIKAFTEYKGIKQTELTRVKQTN